MRLVFFFLYIPFWQNIIGTTPIPYEYYLFPISYGFGLLLIDEAVCPLAMTRLI